MAKDDTFHLGVKALLRDPEGKILLLGLSDLPPGLDAREAYWDLPGGRVQRGEGLESALRREVEEETGLHLETTGPLVGATRTDFRFKLGDDADIGLILFAYLVQLPDRPEVILSSEHSEAWWATPDEAGRALRRFGTEFADRVHESLSRGQPNEN